MTSQITLRRTVGFQLCRLSITLVCSLCRTYDTGMNVDLPGRTACRRALIHGVLARHSQSDPNNNQRRCDALEFHIALVDKVQVSLHSTHIYLNGHEDGYGLSGMAQGKQDDDD